MELIDCDSIRNQIGRNEDDVDYDLIRSDSNYKNKAEYTSASCGDPQFERELARAIIGSKERAEQVLSLPYPRLSTIVHCRRILCKTV